MNGMIFAAGLGTRLAPLTDTKPKALVELNGKPLIEYAIEQFAKGGVTTLVINVHHFAQQIIDYVNANANKWPEMTIKISDEQDFLLDTGGGLVKALNLFPDDKPIVVGNADVFCNVPIDWFYNLHVKSGRSATLLTRTRNSTRQLLFDKDGRLSGWRNKTTGEERLPRINSVETLALHESAFCGFHVIDQGLIRFWLPVRKFSIIDAYLSVAADDNIGQVNLPYDYYWFDIGTPEKLKTAQDYCDKQHSK
ncbi:MAG: nucleotidyltransferase family protein [Bacteroidales bacterium]|nr:nucleotidyltransferase family protein [Bacteroidales bacterium]